MKMFMRSLRTIVAALGFVTAMGASALAQDLAPVKVTFIQHCCPGITFFQPMQFGAEEVA